MANSKSKTQQKSQADEPKVIERDEDPTGVDWSKLEQNEPESKEQSRKDEKRREGDEPTPVVSFQDLDEPDENLPGIVAPKKEN